MRKNSQHVREREKHENMKKSDARRLSREDRYVVRGKKQVFLLCPEGHLTCSCASV